jgi:putative cell wall-binding protein
MKWMERIRPVVALVTTLSFGLAPVSAFAAPYEGDEITKYQTKADYLAAAPDAEKEEVALEAQATAWRRLSGSNRMETMQKIVGEAYNYCPKAILASDSNFPDALAASSLAGALDCPVLLCGAYGMPSETYSELMRLGVKDVYIVGGEAVISPTIEQTLADSGISSKRLAGIDRQETSLAIEKELRNLQNDHEVTKRSDMVIVATGASFADALSIAPWAFATASPILLTKADGKLSDAQVNAIEEDKYVDRLIAVGGTSVIPETITDQVKVNAFERLGGSNRYETSAKIASWEVGHNFKWDGTVVATGKNFPDALTGAALAGKNKTPLLLGDDLMQASLKELREHEADITYGFILGGTGAVPFDDPLEKPQINPNNDPQIARAQQYESATDWLILIDTTENRLRLFNGSKDQWALYDTWPVTTGKAQTPTVKGVYATYEKGYSFDGDVYTCYYYTAFYGSYLMHSTIYAKHTFDHLDPQLGNNASMGCVRMDIERAKWVYENIPLNTTVVTY